VRTALSGANANVPKGHFANGGHTWTIQDNDQLFKAVDYEPLIIAYRNSAPVRVGRCRRRSSIRSGYPHRRLRQRQAFGPADYFSPARRQHHRDGEAHQCHPAPAARLESRTAWTWA
jgi:hypothetical protein